MALGQERTTTRGTGQKWRKADTATTSKLSFSLSADPGGQRPGEPPGQGGQGGQGGQVKQEPEQVKAPQIDPSSL